MKEFQAKINSLENNQVVIGRLGKHGRDQIEWGCWKKIPLYVQKYKGRVVCLTPTSDAWAEFGMCDMQESENGIFMDAEEYCLEIKI